MTVSQEILQLTEETEFVDTHEHLLEESTRLLPPDQSPRPGQSLQDFAVLFSHYADSDLLVAGMPEQDMQRLLSPDVDAADKWPLVEPYYEHARHTGYLRNVRESVRMLFDEDDIRSDNYAAITDKIREMTRPGYYRHILKDVSRLKHTQVNSLETGVFMDTQYPDLLCQDLSFVAMSTGINIAPMSELADMEIRSLQDWHRAIDWCFETYGPRAIAVKNQSAYSRTLDYQDLKSKDVAGSFEKVVRDEPMSSSENKAIQDHLFNYCVRRATEFNLPVKLHTGYYAGQGGMPLHRLRHNAGDMCELLKLHPKTRFVIMHITWPYQDEAIAIAKHYPNAYVDMCWAWIINPAAGVRFVKEFLMAAPANKLFTFGGDYMPVELVPGHARIARMGIAQALSELAEEGWIDSDSVPDLVKKLMYKNAEEVFDYEGTLKNWWC